MLLVDRADLLHVGERFRLVLLPVVIGHLPHVVFLCNLAKTSHTSDSAILYAISFSSIAIFLERRVMSSSCASGFLAILTYLYASINLESYESITQSPFFLNYRHSFSLLVIILSILSSMSSNVAGASLISGNF
jgi:hypothetical protein